MAKIIINEKLQVNGNLSFRRGVESDGDKLKIAIEGMLATHLYFEDIETLETPRYKLTGVEVYQEDFGSDDYNIIYHFKAKRLDITGYHNDEHGTTYCLYAEEMEQIENEMYRDDHPVLGNIGEKYKDMVIKEEGENNDSGDTEQN